MLPSSIFYRDRHHRHHGKPSIAPHICLSLYIYISLREAVIVLPQLTVLRALAFKRSSNLQQAEDTLEVDAWAQRTRSGEGCVRLDCVCCAPNFIKLRPEFYDLDFLCPLADLRIGGEP